MIPRASLSARMMVATSWFIAIFYNLAGTMPTVYTANGLCNMMKYKSKAAMKTKEILGVSLVYFIPIFILIYGYSRMAFALQTKVSHARFSITILLIWF